MRNAMRLFAVCMSFVALAVLTRPAFAVPSHTLKGRYNVSTVEMDCMGASGTFFNTAHGGYGCATAGGTVTCTSKGKCTGTCSNCAARQLSNGGIRGVLHGGNAGLKSGGNTPPKRIRHPVNVGGIKSNPGGYKQAGTNSHPVTMVHNSEHHFGTHR